MAAGSDKDKPVSTNNALYLQNFKGLSNIGAHETQGKGGKQALNFGLQRYLQLNLKLSQVDNYLC